MEFIFKPNYGISDLLEIMRILRRPGGCPWDREQTHKSIRSNFIEETYEVCEAIDREDPYMLKEELGDVLLQVVFHAQMESELGTFDFDAVCDGICKKLIERHPHVFGEVRADTSEQVLDNWEKIKQSSKNQKTATDAIGAVPKQFPSLMRAQKVQKRAAKFGFEFPDDSQVFDKIAEEAAEVKNAADEGGKDAVRDEIGDLLFSVVNLSRRMGVDAEEALSFSTDKFAGRVADVEKLLSGRNATLSELSAEEFDELWERVKNS
ncbi:MAG: nucleoside triphosphate pyrophosphohydrolase [Clostridia bacterium]|nr:nucleoside triphosphate pyrophosphohydrolase [Clostridia bacterium]